MDDFCWFTFKDSDNREAVPTENRPADVSMAGSMKNHRVIKTGGSSNRSESST